MKKYTYNTQNTRGKFNNKFLYQASCEILYINIASKDIIDDSFNNAKKYRDFCKFLYEEFTEKDVTEKDVFKPMPVVVFCENVQKTHFNTFLFNSSIWIYYCSSPVDPEYSSIIKLIKKNYEKGLYTDVNAIENFEYQLRSQADNLLDSIGGHSYYITPTLFSDELRCAEDILSINTEKEITKQKFPELIDLHDVTFRILLIDDKDGYAKSGNYDPNKSKANLIANLMKGDILEPFVIEKLNELEKNRFSVAIRNLKFWVKEQKGQTGLSKLLNEITQITSEEDIDNKIQTLKGISNKPDNIKEYVEILIFHLENLKNYSTKNYIAERLIWKENIEFYFYTTYEEKRKEYGNNNCFEITRHKTSTNVQIIQVTNLADAIILLANENIRFDLILLDYLLGPKDKEKDKNDRQLSTDFFIWFQDKQGENKDVEYLREQLWKIEQRKQPISIQKIIETENNNLKEEFSQLKSDISRYIKEIQTLIEHRNESTNKLIDKLKEELKKLSQTVNKSVTQIQILKTINKCLSQLSNYFKGNKFEKQFEPLVVKNKELQESANNLLLETVENRKKVLAYSKELRQRIKSNRGPLRKLWIFPITAFNETLIDDLTRNNVRLIDYYWHISKGADPITTPYLFLRMLNSFLYLQLESSVFMEHEIKEFLKKSIKRLNKVERSEDFIAVMGSDYTEFVQNFMNRSIIYRDKQNNSLFANYIWKNFYSNEKYKNEHILVNYIHRFYHRCAFGGNSEYRKMILFWRDMKLFIENNFSDWTKELNLETYYTKLNQVYPK